MMAAIVWKTTAFEIGTVRAIADNEGKTKLLK